MRELHYIDDVLIVDDEVCLAVFEYAVALARVGHADLITIPILWNRSRETSNLVLGPSSQLFCTPTAVDGENIDLGDRALIEDLRRRRAQLGPITAIATPAAEAAPTGSVDDF